MDGHAMKRWRLWVGLIVLFVSGVLIGFWGGGYAQKRIIVQRLEAQPGERGRLIMQRLTGWLDLSEEQQRKIAPLVKQAQTELEAEWAQYLPKVRQIRQESTDEIRKLLTPKQREKYDRYLERQKERHLKRKTGKSNWPAQP
jgi:hypothetical protein